LPEQSVPTSKKALTVWPSSTFDEGLNSAGALYYFIKYLNENFKINRAGMPKLKKKLQNMPRERAKSIENINRN